MVRAIVRVRVRVMVRVRVRLGDAVVRNAVGRKVGNRHVTTRKCPNQSLFDNMWSEHMLKVESHEFYPAL